MNDKTSIRVRSDADIGIARQRARALATELGFPATDLTLIVTAISELARNIILYARQGEIVLRVVEDGYRRGIVLMARDEGPGIPNITQAMRNGYSTSGGLGLGLPGVRRVMDEFDIVSEVGKGTTITVKKWKR